MGSGSRGWLLWREGGGMAGVCGQHFDGVGHDGVGEAGS